jgi:hypothetical protein
MRGAAVAVALALPVGLVAAAGPATAAPKPKPKTAMVTALHGIPGVTVDVYANGNLLIDNFTPGTMKTMKVPGGSYDIAITADGMKPTDPGMPLLAATADVRNGKSYTIAAFLSPTADGKAAPAIKVFQNNQAKMPKGKGRLTVRHIAAAPAVDVFLNGNVAFSGLTNPNQVSGVVPKGTYQAAAGVAGAGTAGIALGPLPVSVRQGWNTIVYAWGIPQAAGGAGVQVAVQYVKAS